MSRLDIAAGGDREAVMIVVCKLPSGLDIGGFLLRGAMVGHEPWQRAVAPGRERIAGYEVTRDVPDSLWQRWRNENANGPIVQRGLVEGFDDELKMQEWCYAHANVRGWGRAGG
jgi:hypothetical protein